MFSSRGQEAGLNLYFANVKVRRKQRVIFYSHLRLSLVNDRSIRHGGKCKSVKWAWNFSNSGFADNFILEYTRLQTRSYVSSTW